MDGSRWTAEVFIDTPGHETEDSHETVWMYLRCLVHLLLDLVKNVQIISCNVPPRIAGGGKLSVLVRVRDAFVSPAAGGSSTVFETQRSGAYSP